MPKPAFVVVSANFFEVIVRHPQPGSKHAKANQFDFPRSTSALDPAEWFRLSQSSRANIAADTAVRDDLCGSGGVAATFDCLVGTSSNVSQDPEYRSDDINFSLPPSPFPGQLLTMLRELNELSVGRLITRVRDPGKNARQRPGLREAAVERW